MFSLIMELRPKMVLMIIMGHECVHTHTHTHTHAPHEEGIIKPIKHCLKKEGRGRRTGI
jgi:hypothetical protein